MRQFIKSALVLTVALFACCEVRAGSSTHIALHGEEVSYLGGEVNFPEIVLMNVGVAQTVNGTTIKSQRHSIVFTTEDEWDDDYGPGLANICMPNWVESFVISVDYCSESVKGSCKFSDFDPMTLVNVDGHLSKTFSSSLAGGGGFTRTYVDPVTTKGHMKIKRNFGSQRRVFKLWCVDAVFGDIIGSDYQSPEAYHNTFWRAYVVTQPGQGFKLDYEGNAVSKKVVGMHTGEGDDIDDFGVLTIPGYVVSSIADRAFVDCEFPATKVVLPGGNFTVGTCAFSGCSSLQSIEIANSGKMCFDIGDYAFDGCTGLTSVHLPACVNKVGKGVFAHCANLREFTVDDANSMSLSVRNGCLCDKLGLTLLACPASFTSVMIPLSITSIQYGAFMGCDNLVNVTTDPGREDWVAEQMIASGFNFDRVSLNGRRYGAKKWTVAFDLGEYGMRVGGGALEQSIYDGEAAVAPVVQPEEGYEFYGWDADFGNVTGPMTVRARYTKDGRLSDGDGYTEAVNGYLWAFSIVNGEAVVEQGISPVPIDELAIPSEFGGCPVTAIGVSAFDNDYADMSGLTSVTIPACVTHIGDWAFYGCKNLKSVCFAGDRPEVGYGIYNWAGPVTTYVREGTSGWGAESDEWCGRPIERWATYPEVPCARYTVRFELGEHARRIGGGELVQRVEECCAAELPVIETDDGWEFLAWDADVWNGGWENVMDDLQVFARFKHNGIADDGMYQVITNGYAWTVQIMFGMARYLGVSPEPEGHLDIPGEFLGCPAAQIAFAFCGCTNLTSVTIPDGATYISGYGFANTSIARIDLPESIADVFQYAFSQVSSPVGETNGVPFRGYGRRLEEVVIHSGDIRFSPTAFRCDNKDGGFDPVGDLKSIRLEMEGCVLVGWKHLLLDYDEDWNEVMLDGDIFAADDFVTAFSAEPSVPHDEWSYYIVPIVQRVDGESELPDLGESPTEKEIVAVLCGFVDGRLQSNIKSGRIYNAYRLWVGSVKGADGALAGLKAVRNSPTAWMSFALDQTTLLERNLTDEDLKIEEFKPSVEAGTFDFTVSIKDVTVGPLAMTENLKKTFGLEGTTELVSSAFDDANVDIEFGMPEDGKLKLTAEPLGKDARSFFMKMKVR